MKALILGCAIVYVASFGIIAGWYYAMVQEVFPREAEQDRRKDAGDAVLNGLVFALVGPPGVLLAFWLSGWAHHGWRFPGAARPMARKPYPPAMLKRAP
jgi:hypothetical protein